MNRLLVAVLLWVLLTVDFTPDLVLATPEPPKAKKANTTAKVEKAPESAPEPKWDDLTKSEKIRLNPNNCDLDHTEVMWADGSCHKVVSTTAEVPLTTPPPAPSGSCMDWIVQAGVPADQRDAAHALIMRESGCNPTIWNSAGSGAYGIPQALPGSKMASHGSDWQTNPITQIKWFIDYCNSRYGSIVAANSFQLANNWY